MSQQLNEALCHIALGVDRIERALADMDKRAYEAAEVLDTAFAQVNDKLDALTRREARQSREIGKIMASLDDVVTEVEATHGAADSVLVILDRLVAELEAANQSGDPAKVDAVLVRVAALKQKLADAAAANP